MQAGWKRCCCCCCRSHSLLHVGDDVPAAAPRLYHSDTGSRFYCSTTASRHPLVVVVVRLSCVTAGKLYRFRHLLPLSHDGCMVLQGSPSLSVTV